MSTWHPRPDCRSCQVSNGRYCFDPWSNKEINRLVNAAKFFDRASSTWTQSLHASGSYQGKGHCPGHGALTRRLANKALREYRKGRIDQALLWIAQRKPHETPRCGVPGLGTVQKTASTSMTSWRRSDRSSIQLVSSGLPTTDPQIFHARVSRFHNAFFPTGPVIFNENSGQNEWEKAYEIGLKKKYNYHD